MDPSFKPILIACCFVAAVIVGMLAVIGVSMTRGEIPASAKRQIRIGTPRSTVLELCGPPTGEGSTDMFFDYDRPGTIGWYVVWFDDEGLVRKIDDESF